MRTVVAEFSHYRANPSVDNRISPTLSLNLWKSCSCPPDPLRFRREWHSAVFLFFIYLGDLYVNLFPQAGGNCAQMVRRRRLRADARAAVVARGAHPDG